MGITLLRCDDRLIHGQCIVRILNDYKVEEIVLVDNFTANNPVLVNIYKMSVPPNVSITVNNTDDAIQSIETASMSNKNTLVLVKNPVVALKLQQGTNSLPKELNVGPMSNRNDTKKATFFAYVLDSEIKAMEELEELGIRVYFQQVPDEKVIDFKDLKNSL